MKQKHNQKHVLLVVAVIVIAVAVLALENPFRPRAVMETAPGAEDVGINIGNTAPDFSLRAQRSGDTVRLSDFRGSNVVLNFWATWCPFCLDEMPKFESEMKKYSNIEVVGVNLQESDIAKMNRFADDLGVTYTLLLDPDGDVKRAYNVFTQPVTYFIDENGIIVDRKFGPLTDSEIEQRFAELAAT